MNLFYVLLIFIVFSLISIITKESKNRFHIFVKPLSIFIIIIYYSITIYNTKNWSLVSISGIFALICGALGDIFLAEDEKYFFQGLLAFLVGHIFYIIHFYKPIPINIYSTLIILLVYFFTISTIIFLLKFSNTKYRNIIIFPVVIYTIVLTTMFIFVGNYSLSINYFVPLLGAFLFILSDTILTIHIFVKKIILGNTIILSTYYISQLFLFFGLIHSK